MSTYDTHPEYERGAEEALEGLITIDTPEERNTILAALRLWQHTDKYGILPVDLVEIATNDGAHDQLDDAAIDALCERINIKMEGE